MKTLDFKNADYAVSWRQGYTLSEAMRLWKTKFETFEHFRREVIVSPYLAELGAFINEMWDSIEPLTVTEALTENNSEKRRVMFDCIGVTKLFAQMEPTLLDRQVITKERTRWDEQNRPYKKTYDDTYELYQIDGEKMFGPDQNGRSANPVYAVRCWCTTTGREYWIYVPEEAAMGVRSWQRKDAVPDAVRAIAWTIRIDIKNPSRIYRQGDIIVVEEDEQSSRVEPYHLSKEQYLELMFSET